MRTKAIWAALAALCVVTPAAAEDCTKPLTRLTSLPMTQANASGLVTIPVSLNGVEKQFLFDTGGLFPQVASSVVDELKLPRLASALKLYAVDGAVSESFTKIQTFIFGNLRATNFSIPISPNTGIDGIFSPIAFPAYDFDMDFAGRTLSVFSSDHCDGRVIYWPAKAVAAVAIVVRDYHITVPVTVDGHELTAVLDTGASTSTMRLDVARYVFGIAPDASELKVVSHLGDDEKASVYSYPFKSLTFDGITVTNPQIRILTDIVNKNADHRNETGSHIKTVSDDLTLPEVIVGMDVLRRLHVYLALKEKRLYLTEASSPVTAAGPGSATPAVASSPP